MAPNRTGMRACSETRLHQVGSVHRLSPHARSSSQDERAAGVRDITAGLEIVRRGPRLAHLIVQTHGTLLDFENECEQDTVSLEGCAPSGQDTSGHSLNAQRGSRGRWLRGPPPGVPVLGSG